MGYKDAYKGAREDGQTENVNVQIIRFAEEGQEIYGEFLRRTPLEDNQYDNDVQKYLFDTDHGRISFVGGQYFDDYIGEYLKEGGLYRVEYLGKQEISDGQSVRRWNVEQFGDDSQPWGGPPGGETGEQVTQEDIPD